VKLNLHQVGILQLAQFKVTQNMHRHMTQLQFHYAGLNFNIPSSKQLIIFSNPFN